MDSNNYDYSLVVLTEVDVDDPRVHVDLDKLTTYDRDHLLQWLKFRGDELKHIDTMKEIRTRVLQYFNNKTDSLSLSLSLSLCLSFCMCLSSNLRIYLSHPPLATHTFNITTVVVTSI